MRSYGGYALITSTSYTDLNCYGPGNAQVISYYVYAFNGTWPLSCVSSPNSNTVNFSINSINYQ